MCYYKDFMMKRILLLSLFILTISLFGNEITSADSQKNYLKGKFYSSVKDHFLVATEKMNDESFKKTLTNFFSFNSTEVLKQAFKIFLLYSFITLR